MSRRKGSLNSSPTYYSKDRLKKKAAKLAEDIAKYIEACETNERFSNIVDFNSLNKTIDNLQFCSTAEL